MVSLVNSTEHYRKKLHPVSTIYSKREAEETFLTWFNKNRITLIQKLDEEVIRKKNYGPISLMNIDTKIFNKFQQITINNV